MTLKFSANYMKTSAYFCVLSIMRIMTTFFADFSELSKNKYLETT
jgi:hypothetical protein